MCQSIEEGGRRCPIHRHESIVALAQARKSSGLDADQTTDVFNTLRREGRHSSVPTDTEWNEYLNELAVSTRGQEGAAAQIASAREGSKPGGDTFYALNRINGKTNSLANTLNAAVNRLSRSLGLSNTATRERFNALYAEVDRSRGAETPTEFNRAIVRGHISAGLPADVSTVTALARLRRGVLPAATTTPVVEPAATAVVESEPVVEQVAGPRIQRVDIAGSGSPFATGGYDPDGGRLELTFRNREDMVYAYHNVPEATWTAIAEGGHAGAVYSREIRSHREYQYATREAGEADANTVRCNLCGQFAAASHTCPGRAREEVREHVAPMIRAELANQNLPEEVIEEAIESVVTARTPDVTISSTPPVEPVAEVAEVAEVASSPVEASVDGEVAIDTAAIALQLNPPALSTEINVSRSLDIHTPNSPYWNTGVRNVSPRDLSYYLPEDEVTALNIVSNDPRRFVIAQMYTDSGQRVMTEPTSVNGYRRDRYEVVATWNNTEEDVNVTEESSEHMTHLTFRHRGTPVASFESSYANHTDMKNAEAELYAATANGQLERETVSANSTLTRRYKGEANRDDRLSWANVRDFRRAIADGKVVESSIRWEGNRGTDYTDVHGNEIRAGSFVVSGTLAVRRNANGTFESVSGRHELRCNCNQYRRNYHCVHVDLVRNNSVNVAQQMATPIVAAGIEGAPTGVFARPDVTYVAPVTEGGDSSITFTGGTHDYRQRRGGLTLPSDYDENDISTSRLAFISSRASIFAPPAGVISQALRRATTVTIPYMSDGHSVYVGRDYVSLPTVRGTITLQREEDGTASVHSRSLRCTCPQYRETYDCEHIRNSVDRAPRLAVAGISNPENISAVESQNRALSVALVREQEAVNILNSGRVSTIEEARVQVVADEASAQARREEREREYQRTNAERIAAQAERERVRNEEWARDNAVVVAEWAEHRDKMEKRWEGEVAPAYSTSPEAFHKDVEDALDRKKNGEAPIIYETENVTDGICAPGAGNRKFGIELEFDIKSGVNKTDALRAIGRELHAAGLTPDSRQTGYHSAQRTGWQKWSFEQDCTVAGELVSPLMADTPEDWAQLQTACEILNRNGATATIRAGSHVHVSTGSYGQSTAKHAELLRMVNENQDSLYRLASDPKRGKHRGTRWCAPNAVDSADAEIPATVLNSHGVLGYGNTSHGVALNFEGTGQREAKKSHVEFRMWDATLDPSVIQQQVKISAAMTEAAERTVETTGFSRRNPTRSASIGTARAKEQQVLVGKTKHDVESLAQSSEPIRAFADRLFRRESDKKGFAALFAITKWQLAA